VEQKMNNPIETVQEVFGISSLREAIIGGTIMSVNPAVGSAINSSSTMDTKKYLCFYPELVELEKEAGNPYDFMGLSTIWNVGFVSQSEKLNTPDFFSGQSVKYLKNRKIKTVDQLFSRRSENATCAFFSCFKLLGADNTITPNNYSDIQSELDEFKRYGLICNNWINEPQTINYVVKVDGKKKTRDYLYLIGGICNPDDILLYLTQTFQGIINFKQQKGIPRDISAICSELSDVEKIWSEFNSSKIIESVLNNPNVEYALKVRYLTRIIHATISLHSYFTHIKKHLELTSVYKVNNGKLEESVTIDTMLKKIEEPYEFCKNIVLYNETQL
jgi:hypothetical protein